MCLLTGLISAHGGESWVGVTVWLLALQDGEVTIIMQTIKQTMFLAKLRRLISHLVNKVGGVNGTVTVVKLLRSQKLQLGKFLRLNNFGQ